MAWTMGLAASTASVVLVAVTTPAVARDVIVGPDGVLDGSTDLIIDFTTHDVESATELHKKVLEAGARYLYAPLMGGERGARSGALSIFVGGDIDDYRKAEALLGILASDLTYVGTPRDAAVIKLVNNLLSLVNTAVFIEAFALAAKLGVDSQRVYDVIQKGSGFSTTLERRWAANFVPRNFSPGFSVELAVKDLRLAQEAADSAGVPLITGTAGAQVYKILLNDGHGKDDVSVMAQWYERLLGVRIEAGPPFQFQRDSGLGAPGPKDQPVE